MAAHYRVALHGFSEFERTSLAFCLKHAGRREPVSYVQVALIADSDFIVADASHDAIAGSQTRLERMHDTLFVGDKAPFGASAHVKRPIDPERILRALDDMAAQRRARSRSNRPDVVLPLDAVDMRFPLLDPADIVDTTPAAFQHEPLSISFTDLETFQAAETEASALAETTPASLPPPTAPPPSPPSPPSPPRPPPAAPSPPSSSAASARAKPAPFAKLSEVERAEAKAAARRASRLARLAQSADAGAGSPHDVLLLDATPGSAALVQLLEAFGFQVHRAEGIAQAMSVLQRTPLAAAFVDAAAQDVTGIDGLGLCQQIKQRQLPLAGSVPAVMLLAERDSAAGRVRAKLAGCDAFLIRPVARGDAARALESCNVALPADARRA